MRLTTTVAAAIVLAVSPQLSAAPVGDCNCAPTPSCAVPSCAAPADACHSCNESCHSCGASICGDAVCGTCGCLPECGVCGTNQCCWDCSYDEGTDIESLTPEAQSKTLYDASQARIEFELPETAGVWLGSQKMMTPGGKRTFVVPIADRTKIYKYEARIDVVIHGKKYFRRIPVNAITAGTILSYKITVPEIEEGATPIIDHEAKTLAAGGVGTSGT
ncbi:MAG: hypothetical protein KDA85_01170 [Planctomycetaceae bacterium]|nr:hypothetical protein [Planctomycetaceae bacterium]